MADVCEEHSPEALKAILPGTRLKVLRLMSADPQACFSITELIEQLKSGRGVVQREVARLVGCGLLCQREDRRGRRYAFNSSDTLAKALLPFLSDHSSEDIPSAVASVLSQLSDPYRFCAVINDLEADSAVAIVVGENIDEANLQRELGDVCVTRLFSPDDFICSLREGVPLVEQAVHGPRMALLRPKNSTERRKTQVSN